MSYSIEQIKREARGFFFSPGSISFFSSRVSSRVYSAGDMLGQYFVTSERDGGYLLVAHGGQRRYTVRRYDPVNHEVGIADGHEFMEYQTLSGAHRAAERDAATEAYESVRPARGKSESEGS